MTLFTFRLFPMNLDFTTLFKLSPDWTFRGKIKARFMATGGSIVHPEHHSQVTDGINMENACTKENESCRWRRQRR